MSTVTITIHTDNFAFDGEGYDGEGPEVARILRHAAMFCEEFGVPKALVLRDSNGNTVGGLQFTGESR